MYIVKRKIRAGGQSLAVGTRLTDEAANGLNGFGELVKTKALEKAEEAAEPKSKGK
jgi:hypothetical protein